MSFQMAERQKARKRGRYTNMLKCEDCGKPVGFSYYSAPGSGETGVGLVLCKACAKKVKNTQKS